jgi:4-hydroxy-3-methylbut-2-enyl diphosphate reductase
VSDGPLIASPLSIEVAIVRSGARGAVVRKTGMGPKRAAATARTLAGAPGEALLVLGFCGGLDAESVPGEVIVAESVSAAADEGHDVPARVACADAEGLARALRDRGMTVRSGEIVCVSKLALGERRAQLLAGGALAVDMESVWLAPGAAGRPFAVVRVVLDSPSHELMRPRAAVGAVRAARMLRRVAGALSDWTPSLRMASEAEPETICEQGAGSTAVRDRAQGD